MRLVPRPGADDVQRELATLESHATRLRYFLTAIPTGLIQTPEYMRQVMTQTSPVVGKDVERVIARKLERQAVVDGLDKRFEFLLMESAIRWQLCEAAVMARQVKHLVSLSHRTNIDIKGASADGPGRRGSVQHLHAVRHQSCHIGGVHRASGAARGDGHCPVRPSLRLLLSARVPGTWRGACSPSKRSPSVPPQLMGSHDRPVQLTGAHGTRT